MGAVEWVWSTIDFYLNRFAYRYGLLILLLITIDMVGTVLIIKRVPCKYNTSWCSKH